MSTTKSNQKNLQNLFRPGTGDQPPYLAGRETEKQIFHTALGNLIDHGRNPPGHIICYGPRGNGKTALLRNRQKTLQEKQIKTLWLSAPALQDKESFITGITIETEKKIQESNQKSILKQWTRLLQWIQPEVTIGSPEDVQTQIRLNLLKRPKNDFRPVTLREVIQQLTQENKDGPKEPFILFIDEAHTITPDLGQMILNDSQMAIGENLPFLLVLAGTPQLEDHLRKISATFWSRNKKIKLGRISEKATQDAITIPLRRHNVHAENDALRTITEQAQGYPYFTQLWGHAVCQQLQHTQDTTLTSQHVERAQESFTQEKDLYYLERYQELKDNNLLSLAESTGKILLGNTGPIDEELLEQALQDETQQARKTIQKGIKTFKTLGYLWMPGTAPEYEPGIPSLMTYILEQHRKRGFIRQR